MTYIHSDFGRSPQLNAFLALRSITKPRVCQSDEQEKEPASKTPLFDGFPLTFHHLGLIVSAAFGSAAVIIAFFLIWRHASHYLKPAEQKYIIRILLMIPIYAVVSFLSYMHYRHAIYYEVLRDCYEAFAISSFFTLMCHYIAPNLHEQKQYFRNIEPKNWVWPVTWMQKCSGGENKGLLRKPQSGLTWFNIVWVAIFQYCFVRPFFTVVAVVTQANHVYCQSSKDPRYAYIWVAAFEAISVTIAMYCLIQFYLQLKQDLAPYKPFLKVLCIKLVIFFCFWQSWIISLLATPNGPLKPTPKIAGPDWRVGLPSMLVCFEMSIFAIMHLFAFPWKPYDLGKRQQQQEQQNPFADPSSSEPQSYACGPFRALASAFNPWDIIKAFSRGMRWLFVGRRHRKNDPSYQTKLGPVSSETIYAQGPTFAGNGDAATEISRPALASGRTGRADPDDPDTVGLLHPHADPYARSDTYSPQPSPIYPDSFPASPVYGGHEYRTAGAGPPRYDDLEHRDTTYHGAGRDMHMEMARFPQENVGRQRVTEWDMFAGAAPPPGRSRGNSNSNSPPGRSRGNSNSNSPPGGGPRGNSNAPPPGMF